MVGDGVGDGAGARPRPVGGVHRQNKSIDVMGMSPTTDRSSTDSTVTLNVGQVSVNMSQEEGQKG